MTVKTIKQPHHEPLTLQEVKSYLNIEHAHEDDKLLPLMIAVRDLAETYTGRAFIQQTLCLTTPLDLAHSPHKKPNGISYKLLPGRVAIRLPRPPLMHIEQVQLMNEKGDVLEVPQDKWHINTGYDPAVLIVDCAHRLFNRLQVTYLAGYGEHSCCDSSGA